MISTYPVRELKAGRADIWHPTPPCVSARSTALSKTKQQTRKYTIRSQHKRLKRRDLFILNSSFQINPERVKILVILTSWERDELIVLG